MLTPEVLPRLNLPPSDLTDQDILLMERLFRVKINEQMRILHMTEIGLSDSSEDVLASDFAFELNNAFGRTYWDLTKEFLPFPASFQR